MRKLLIPHKVSLKSRKRKLTHGIWPVSVTQKSRIAESETEGAAVSLSSPDTLSLSFPCLSLLLFPIKRGCLSKVSFFPEKPEDSNLYFSDFGKWKLRDLSAAEEFGLQTGTGKQLQKGDPL